VYGGELLRVFLAEILVLKRRADLNSFEPERGGPSCFAAAMAQTMNSLINRLNFGLTRRQ
jgi:hypothetical protein